VGASTADLERHAAAIGTTVDAFANDANVFGTAQQAIDKVGRVAELGAGRLYFQILDMRDLDQLEYLGTEVLPHLP
jgi:hypothetical protein